MKKFFQKLKSKKGMTLIELVIAIAVFSVIIGAVSAVFAASSQNFKSTVAVDSSNNDTKLEIVLNKYQTAPIDENGIAMIDGYKVEKISYDDLGPIKLEEEGGTDIIDLKPEGTSKCYYRITSPAGLVSYVTYG